MIANKKDGKESDPPNLTRNNSCKTVKGAKYPAIVHQNCIYATQFRAYSDLSFKELLLNSQGRLSYQIIALFRRYLYIANTS